MSSTGFPFESLAGVNLARRIRMLQVALSSACELLLRTIRQALTRPSVPMVSLAWTLPSSFRWSAAAG